MASPRFQPGVKKMSILDNYKFREIYNKRNTIKFTMEDDGMEKWKSIINYLEEYHQENENQLTISSKGYPLIRNKCLNGWNVYHSAAGSKLYIHMRDKGYLCFTISVGNTRAKDAKNEDPESVSGGKGFTIFTDELSKDGVNIEGYASKDGYEWKKKIPKALIQYCMGDISDMIFEDIHHIDINSAYMAGIAKANPTLAPTIERIYRLRKEHPEYKAVLTNSQGYMQSICTHFVYSKLAYDGVSYCRDAVIKLAAELAMHGREPLLYNTDGIWYKGDVYHGPNEGTELGQWKNDYTHCKFRAKTPGSYEFLCDGKYYPKQRGKTLLDDIKPRSQWEWGDIYRVEANKTKGFIRKGHIYYPAVQEEE